MQRGEIEVRKHLVSLLNAKNAHVPFLIAAKDIQYEQLEKTEHNIPYSLWQQIEHTRLAQKDIIDYTLNENYQPMEWPEDYWPKEPKPASEQIYQQSLISFEADINRMIDYINNPKNDLYESFPYDDGHNLLREALLLADHNAYHTGQIIVIRKILGIW